MIVWIDDTGRVSRWVRAATVVPEGAVELGDDLDPMAIWVDAGGAVHPLPPQPSDAHVFDRETGGWIDPRPATEVLAGARAVAMAKITALRGRARLAYITDIPGQEGIYIAKLEEARAWLAEAEPDLSDYPLIASEVGVTATSAHEVAQIFLNLNRAWKQAAGQIDGACFTAELAVQAAGDVAGVEAAVSALIAILSGGAP